MNCWRPDITTIELCTVGVVVVVGIPKCCLYWGGRWLNWVLRWCLSGGHGLVRLFIWIMVGTVKQHPLVVSSYSVFTDWGASARPFTLSLSAVLRNCGSWSWATFTSPAYINSRMAVRCWNGTSFKMMMGCLAGFSSNRALKYGLQADKIILWALQLCPSQARVTSVKDFSSLRCLNEATMLVWKSFHLRQNCCWSSTILVNFGWV